jgi:hypothetical protein
VVTATAVTLEKALHIQEDVIRHMLIRGIMGSDEPPPEFVGSDRPRFAPRPPMGAEPRAEMRAPMDTTAEASEGAVQEEAAAPSAEAMPEAAVAVAPPEAPAAEAPPEAAPEPDAD